MPSRQLGTYMNYDHGNVPDAAPGIDPDFSDSHQDDPRVGASQAEIDKITKLEQSGYDLNDYNEPII